MGIFFHLLEAYKCGDVLLHCSEIFFVFILLCYYIIIIIIIIIIVTLLY